MTTTAKIGASLASPTFSTTTAKVTWTPSATNWTGYAPSTKAPWINKVAVYLWGSAADKTGEDPYKTMNTWYTTNKAAIDAAGLASTTQVSSWALYIDVETTVAGTAFMLPLNYDSSSPVKCEVTHSTPNTVVTGSTTYPNAQVKGSWGDAFAIGL